MNLNASPQKRMRGLGDLRRCRFFRCRWPILAHKQSRCARIAARPALGYRPQTAVPIPIPFRPPRALPIVHPRTQSASGPLPARPRFSSAQFLRLAEILATFAMPDDYPFASDRCQHRCRHFTRIGAFLQPENILSADADRRRPRRLHRRRQIHERRAITISQCFESPTAGANCEKNSGVWAAVLYIFQLPAITGVRML